MRWSKFASRSVPSRSSKRIHLYAQSWNEERLLPFFFRHYDPFVERYVFYDDNSSDATREMLGRHPRVEIRRFERTDPNSFILSTQELQNKMWKESRGACDWVIITVVDEHLYHPDFAGYLAHAKRKGITVIPGLGYEMLSAEFPPPDMHLATGVRRGVAWHKKSKLSVFDPDAIQETNFTAGRHKAQPTGRVRYPARDELLNLHFKWLGCDYVQSRSDLLRKGLGSVDRNQNWGHQYDFSDAENRKRLQDMLAASIDVRALGDRHHETHDGKRWWRTHKGQSWGKWRYRLVKHLLGVQDRVL